MHRLWVYTMLAAMAFLPMADAQEVGFQNPDTPTPTTMYVHLNHIQEAPINTQLPDDRYSQNSDVGLVQHSQGCYEVPETTLVNRPHHTSYGYSTPGYVQYDIDEGNKPRFHDERGISYDVELEPGSEVMFHWYLATQVTSGTANGTPDPNQAPLAVPSVVVRGTIREGDQISVGAEAYNQGTIVAQGQSDPVDLHPMVDHPQIDYAVVDGYHVYGFHFPLSVENPTIRKDESFNLRVDVFMDNPVCNEVADDEYLMPDSVRTHTSPENRPRFEWNVMNPIKIISLHPQAIGDDLVVHAHVNSAWGNYDVLGDSGDHGDYPTLTITGPSKPVQLQLLAWAEHFGQHGGDTHTQPVAAAWGWPTVQEAAQPGEYTVELTIKNDQETAVAKAVAAFQIGDDHRVGSVTGCGHQGADGCVEEAVEPPGGVERSPGPGLWLVPALAALAWLRRPQD